MQDTENQDDVSQHTIGRYIGRMGDDQLSRAGDPSKATAFRIMTQPLDLRADPLIDPDCGARVALLDIVEDLVPVVQGEHAPLQLHL